MQLECMPSCGARLTSNAEFIDVVHSNHLGFVALSAFAEESFDMTFRLVLLAGVAKATGILGDEVPAAYPVTTIHVPVVEGSSAGSSFDQLLQDTARLETIMKTQHSLMGHEFGRTSDATVRDGVASFLARSSAHMGEPTLSDLEAAVLQSRLRTPTRRRQMSFPPASNSL